MTDINCSCNCIYQKDGKCNFQSVTLTAVNKNTDCAYYSPKSKKK